MIVRGANRPPPARRFRHGTDPAGRPPSGPLYTAARAAKVVRYGPVSRPILAAAAPARTVAEVAANIGAAPAEVERWCAEPDFTAAVRRYRFGWSPCRRAALALLVRDGPPWLGLDAVAAAVGVSRRTLYRWRCAPAFAAAVDAAHRARAKLWEAAWLAEADRRHDEAVAKVLRRVRRAR